jgi:hypothetical protein
MHILHLYITYTDNLFCQGHDSAPGLDIMCLQDLTRQDPGVLPHSIEFCRHSSCLIRAESTRRGSHVYEINTWLWNFGRPQPREGGLSVAKTEKIRRKSRSDAAKRGLASVGHKAGQDYQVTGIYLVYTWYIHGIYHEYLGCE